MRRNECPRRKARIRSSHPVHSESIDQIPGSKRPGPKPPYPPPCRKRGTGPSIPPNAAPNTVSRTYNMARSTTKQLLRRDRVLSPNGLFQERRSRPGSLPFRARVEALRRPRPGPEVDALRPCLDIKLPGTQSLPTLSSSFLESQTIPRFRLGAVFSTTLYERTKTSYPNCSAQDVAPSRIYAIVRPRLLWRRPDATIDRKCRG